MPDFLAMIALHRGFEAEIQRTINRAAREILQCRSLKRDSPPQSASHFPCVKPNPWVVKRAKIKLSGSRTGSISAITSLLPSREQLLLRVES